MNKIPRGRKLLMSVCGMPFTIPDPKEVDAFIKQEGYKLRKQNGKRRTKKEWE